MSLQDASKVRFCFLKGGKVISSGNNPLQVKHPASPIHSVNERLSKSTNLSHGNQWDLTAFHFS